MSMKLGTAAAADVTSGLYRLLAGGDAVKAEVASLATATAKLQAVRDEIKSATAERLAAIAGLKNAQSQLAAGQAQLAKDIAAMETGRVEFDKFTDGKVRELASLREKAVSLNAELNKSLGAAKQTEILNNKLSKVIQVSKDQLEASVAQHAEVLAKFETEKQAHLDWHEANLAVLARAKALLEGV